MNARVNASTRLPGDPEIEGSGAALAIEAPLAEVQRAKGGLLLGVPVYADEDELPVQDRTSVSAEHRVGRALAREQLAALGALTIRNGGVVLENDEQFREHRAAVERELIRIARALYPEKRPA